MARLRSDFWVAAYIRRCLGQAVPAMLRRRGSPEAGAILIKVDHLDGTSVLYGPVPQTEVEDNDSDRCFSRLHKADRIASVDAEARLTREIGFDPDLWIVEIEDKAGRSFLD